MCGLFRELTRLSISGNFKFCGFSFSWLTNDDDDDDAADDDNMMMTKTMMTMMMLMSVWHVWHEYSNAVFGFWDVSNEPEIKIEL